MKNLSSNIEYMTVMEVGNTDCPNVGTVTTVDTELNFKEAIESHFDAEMVDYKFVNFSSVENLTDCINGLPVDLLVELNSNGIITEHEIQVSQTWLY